MIVDPRWTCERCNRWLPVPLDRGMGAVEKTRKALRAFCVAAGHVPAVYYTAGVRL